jgi:hypothetical protein
VRAALTLCVILALSVFPGTSRAQSATALDAPLAVLDTCPPGSVVLTPDAAVAAAKRLSAAEAKVVVYEKNPPLPWWGVVIIGVVAAGACVDITAGVYEATKK